MTTRRARGRRAVAIATVIGTMTACAQIETRSTVEVIPRSDARPLVIGPPGGEVTARGVEAAWSQDGDRLTLHLDESRSCATVRHVPVVRVERIHRRTVAGAMWFEYGLGAAAMTGGLLGLIRPESYSQTTISANGEEIRDKQTGYRIGAIFTALGTVLLTAAVVDTVRTRDEERYADAYRREQGDAIACAEPRVPLRGQTVELLVSGWSTVEPTDDGGRVRFLLPDEDDLPEAARDAIAAVRAWDAAKAEAEAKAQAQADAVAAEAAAQAEAEAKAGRGKRGRKGKASGRGRADTATPSGKADAPAGGGATEAGAADGGSQAGAADGASAAAAGDGASGPSAGDGTSGPAEASVADAALGPRPEPFVVRGVLRIDAARALAVDFVVPYDIDAARGHEGAVVVEPMPLVDPPARPRARKAEKASQADAEAKTPTPSGAT